MTICSLALMNRAVNGFGEFGNVAKKRNTEVRSAHTEAMPSNGQESVTTQSIVNYPSLLPQPRLLDEENERA